MGELNSRQCPTKEMVVYSTGECACSLIGNGLAGFAMLYYTNALGLQPYMAGIAMSVSTFWDAVTDPVMGHISDSTRSRYGRRHPYMLIGSILTLVSFYFLWNIPDIFEANKVILFWYLLILNLSLRTFITVFAIPYIALGFEMCTDYVGRAKLQGIRGAMGMAANLIGPGLAWSVFFRNKGEIHAINVPANFINMGTVFTIAAGIFFFIVFFSTIRYMHDSRAIKLSGSGLKGFIIDIKGIIADVNSRWTYVYSFLMAVGTATVGVLQMYLYEHFMQFGGIEKTFAHGGGMIGCGLGGLCSAFFVRKFEKRGAAFFGCTISVACSALLAAIFLPSLLKPGQTVLVLNTHIPVSVIVFVLLHALYYYGAGLMIPVGTSMMADVSEIYELKNGINKDGAYSAILMFIMKCAYTVGILVSGCILSFIGFVAGSEEAQSSEMAWRLCAVTLTVGPAIAMLSLPFIMKYKVSKKEIEQLRIEVANRNDGY